MENVSLTGIRRAVKGTKACHRLRHQGQVPGNVHGHGKESLAIQVPVDQVRNVVRTDAHIMTLLLDGAEESVLLKEVQFDHMGDLVLHVDFERVAMDEEVLVEVNVVSKGHAPGTDAGGVLQHALRVLPINCLPANIPQSIVVDVSKLQLNEVIHVRDLQLPAGVRTEAAPDLVVFQVRPPLEEKPAEEAAVEQPTEPELIRPEGRGEKEGEEEEAEEKKK